MAKLKTGTTVGGVEVVVTTDSRLSDARTPTSHTHPISEVTNLQTTLDEKAPLASPTLTGTPTAPTASAGTNTTQIATTAFVSTAVSNLVDSSPATLDTLNELAAALGDDPDFATTVSTALGNKVEKTSNQALHSTDALSVSGTTVTLRKGDGTTETITIQDTDTTYSAGSGLSLTGTVFANTAPDQTVNIEGAGSVSVSGTYPNFTITGTDTDTDTVTRLRGTTGGTLVSGDITLAAGGATSISQSGNTITISSTDTNTDTNNYLIGVSGSGNGTVTFTRSGLANLTWNAAHTHDDRYYTESEVNTLLGGKLGTSAKAADSNLLDGLDSSAFLRSNANDSASGVISLTNTTDSTSISTGALVVSGGVGIAKNLYVGGDVDLAGKLTVAENATFNGSIDIAEDLSIGGFLNVAGDASFGGSIDIGENLSVGGYLNVAGDASFGGSIDIAEDVNVGGSLRVQESIEAGTVDSSASAIRDNRLFLRYGATTPMGDGEFAGIVAINADGLNDAALLFDGNNKAKVGDINAWLPFDTAATSLSGISTNDLQSLYIFGRASNFDAGDLVLYSYDPTDDIPTGKTAFYYDFNDQDWYEFDSVLQGPTRSIWTPISSLGTPSEATLQSDNAFNHYVCAAFYEKYTGGSELRYILKTTPTLTSPYRIHGGDLYEYDETTKLWYQSVPSLGTTEPSFVSLAGTLNLNPTIGSKIISASTNSSLTIRDGYYIKIPYKGVYGVYGGTWKIYDWNSGTKTFKFQVFKNAESSTDINDNGAGVEILKYAFNDTSTSSTTVGVFKLDNTSDIVVRPKSSELTDRGLVYWNDSSNTKQIETSDKVYIDNSGFMTVNYNSPIRFLGSDSEDRVSLTASPTAIRSIILPDESGIIALTSNIPTNNNELTNGAGYITGIDSNDVTTALGYTPYNSTNPSGYITSSALSGLATETYVNNAVSNLVASAPSTLDTLNELAAALGDDPSFATTVTNSIAGKLSLTGGTMTGTLGVSTIDMGSTGVINFNKITGNVSKIVGANNGIDFYSDDPINFYESDASTIAVSISTNSGSVTATTFTGSLSGNATTATTLQTARTINGTSFNGSGNITTANWGTTRTLTIGSTGKSVNGSGNVSWSLADIGAYAANNPSGYISDYTVTEADVTAHESALTITESQISDLGAYITDYTVTKLDVDTALGTTAANDSYFYRGDGSWAAVPQGDITSVIAGNGLSGGGTSGSVTLNLDFSELTDMTADISGSTEFILQNGITESRKAAGEIKLSAFNNDLGWTSNTGTVSSLGDLGLTATATELNFVDGVTSAIQTQLNGKAFSTHYHSATEIVAGELNTARMGSGTATAGYVLKSDGDGTASWQVDNNTTYTLASFGVTATSTELNTLDGITATTAELNKLDGFTGTATDLNYAKDLRSTGVTTTEFDKLDGVSGSIWHANNLSFSLVGSTLTITVS